MLHYVSQEFIFSVATLEITGRVKVKGRCGVGWGHGEIV